MKNTDASHEGFVEVSHTEFYRTIGPCNVHPRVVGGWGEYCDGYLSDFVNPSGYILGKCFDGSPPRYLLARSAA